MRRGKILGFGLPDEAAAVTFETNADSEEVEPAFLGWDGATLLQALTHLQSEFSQLAPSIDSINVFPVADGDTGANMLATITAAVRSAVSAACELDRSSAPIPAKSVLVAAAEGAIDGARGNSGVILSQFFAGLASVQVDELLDAPALSSGLVAAAHAARKAVARPVDGTIITVMESAAAVVARRDNERLTIGQALELASLVAWEALMQTTNQLSALATAGVVDAGGYGFVVLVEALREFAFTHEEREYSSVLTLGASFSHSTRGAVHLTGGNRHASGLLASQPWVKRLEDGGEPTLCINFMLGPGEYTADAVRDRFGPFGSSIVVVGTHDRLRVHLHSSDVERVLAEARDLGEVAQLQVDEIVEQVSVGRSAAERQPFDDLDCSSRPGRQPLLSLACARGEGLERALMEMGATVVLPVDRTNFDAGKLKLAMLSLARTGADVVLLPNDTAIIQAFRTLIDEAGTVRVHLIETESVPQGIAALAAQQPDLELNQNLSRMHAAALGVRTFVVVRSLLMTGESEGSREVHFRGLVDGNLAERGTDPAAVLVDLIEASEPGGDGLLTVFYGQSIGSELLEAVEREMRERFPRLNFELLAGGQDKEAFIAALE